MPDSTVRDLVALLAETSLHAGTGSQLGAVDLPIQRERHTEWPTVYGSGLKGVLRDHAERSGWPKEDVAGVFGPEVDKGGAGEESRFAGALSVSDARLLLFPVRTVGQPFAWVTCPLALARLARDAAQSGLGDIPRPAGPPDKDTVRVAASWPGGGDGVFLEEFAYKSATDAGVGSLGGWIAARLLPGHPAYGYWRDLVQKALVVVTDDDFRDFVRHGTEVVTRVKLTEQKTVQPGALWTEESLPADSLLYSFVGAWTPARAANGSVGSADAVLEKVRGLFSERWVAQVGGKESVGRGFVAVRFAGGQHA
jgi:CRISPR-associated protein Cmr4